MGRAARAGAGSRCGEPGPASREAAAERATRSWRPPVWRIRPPTPTTDAPVPGRVGVGGMAERPNAEVLKTSGREPRGFESRSLRPVVSRDIADGCRETSSLEACSGPHPPATGFSEGALIRDPCRRRVPGPVVRDHLAGGYFVVVSSPPATPLISGGSTHALPRMEPTPERFVALTRSSPWRWRTLRFRVLRGWDRAPFRALVPSPRRVASRGARRIAAHGGTAKRRAGPSCSRRRAGTGSWWVPGRSRPRRPLAKTDSCDDADRTRGRVRRPHAAGLPVGGHAGPRRTGRRARALDRRSGARPHRGRRGEHRRPPRTCGVGGAGASDAVTTHAVPAAPCCTPPRAPPGNRPPVD